MERQPFTPAGIIALKEWLYQLPLSEFNAEISAMKINFEAWSLAHLELDERQLSFYKQISSFAKSKLAADVTFTATVKRPISLVQISKKTAKNSIEEDKLFKPKSSLTVTSRADGSEDIDGELVIEVTYTS